MRDLRAHGGRRVCDTLRRICPEKLGKLQPAELLTTFCAYSLVTSFNCTLCKFTLHDFSLKLCNEAFVFNAIYKSFISKSVRR